MKLNYHPDTDSIYIDNTSRKVLLDRLVPGGLASSEVERIAG
jgi:uncharacterized protein YuzE